MEFQALTKVIRNRRAIYPRMFSDKPIDDNIIHEILENANWAPTHKKTEPWRFKVFRGKSLQSLSDYLGQYYLDNTPEEKFSQIKYNKTIQKPLKSSCVIAICMYNDPNITIPEWEEVAAVACAIQNMWLSCTTLNIGAYWSSPKSIISAREFLNLDEHEKCLGLFYMGHYDHIELKGQRMTIQDKLTWM